MNISWNTKKVLHKCYYNFVVFVNHQVKNIDLTAFTQEEIHADELYLTTVRSTLLTPYDYHTRGRALGNNTGHKTGVVSNCGLETPILVNNTSPGRLYIGMLLLFTINKTHFRLCNLLSLRCLGSTACRSIFGKFILN